MQNGSRQTFGIGAVARRTGLSASNIRMWESRYEAVVPDRTPSNRRLYGRASGRKDFLGSTFMSFLWKLTLLRAPSPLHSRVEGQGMVQTTVKSTVYAVSKALYKL